MLEVIDPSTAFSVDTTGCEPPLAHNERKPNNSLTELHCSAFFKTSDLRFRRYTAIHSGRCLG